MNQRPTGFAAWKPRHWTLAIILLLMVTLVPLGWLQWRQWQMLQDTEAGRPLEIDALLSAVTLAVAAANWRYGLALLLLQGVFLSDSAVTLLRRFLRRQNVTHAHSEHAYQHSKRRWGHARVSYALFAVTLLVQIPVAYAVAWLYLPFWVSAIDFALPSV